jgi:hypothetical protein
MDSHYFPQFLLNNGKVKAAEAAKLLPLCQKGLPSSAEYDGDRRAFRNLRVEPVREAVLKLAGENLAEEAQLYADYMQLLMDSLVEYMSTPAIIAPEVVKRDENSPPLQTVTQPMNGDISLAPGIMAADREFLILAERMSGEELSTMDELAIDSLQEFINVVNGVFSIKMAEQGLEVELGIPGSKKLSVPQADKLILFRLYAAFGSFYVVLAADEFI